MPGDNALEHRIQQIEYRDEIKALNARYMWHAARGDAAAIVACFTSDGAYDSRPAGNTYRAEGQAALLEHFNRVMKPAPKVILTVHNHVIDVDGDEARGTCVLVSHIGGRLGGGFVGFYQDRYRRVHGKWLFVERIYDHYAEFPYLEGTVVKAASVSNRL